MTGFPTSSDIYLEVDGTRVAVVQSYSAKASKSSTAVVNIGRCPTVTDGTRLTVEANLLDFSGEIYGRQLSLYIIERLRDERKFDSLDSLRRQIAQDITQARTIAATH